METVPQKKEEHYPLLKVDSGAGESIGKPQTRTNLTTPGWAVNSTRKRPCMLRWPEYVSACWMTFILIGISFLVFYGLGIEAYRRQPVFIIHHKVSRPGGDVFYHQILPRGSSVPVMRIYGDYLTYMANQYPSLTFNVYLLVDDTIQSSYRVSRHSRLFNTYIPMPLSNVYPLYKITDSAKRDLEELEKKIPNINITIMSLSKYMSTTPLKYKWRSIPLQYLAFYARVFSVLQNGGVGMDLSSFNNDYNNRMDLDRKIAAILKQHNDGINPEEYANAINKIDREEETELLSMFCGFINSIINETKTFLAKNFQSTPQLFLDEDFNNTNKVLVRTQRNKRNVSTNKNDNITETKPLIVDILNTTYSDNDLKKTEYQELAPRNVSVNETKMAELNRSTDNVYTTILKTSNKSEVTHDSFNKSGHPQLVLFYDFSFSSDGILPSFSDHDSLGRAGVGQVVRNSKYIRQGNFEPSLLSLNSDGTFIAASARFHPFLNRLISAGCQRMHPKIAIQDTIINQCAAIYKEDIYCNNIYII